MLELKNINKDYGTADSVVHALKNVNLKFRKSEFVSILGPSGCGKTTLLNIIGGLDRYTDGDLVINGISTKQYKDRDWDTYRNHSIGFVFQSYNLIPHLSVLKNVEMALTISGISKSKRKEMAVEALKKVGLGEMVNKRPNQMSGGQMQRVAIARAIVNNPDIILADEPTGALDSETSVNVMDILKEISKDKLIIMVTHNPELAQQYSSRIIKFVDGSIVDDSMPYSEEYVAAPVSKNDKKTQKKPSMSFFTALSLSFNNLRTKKARTFLTSFAGSIGIIGIALILSLSSGIQSYIDTIERETLSAYPIQIDSQTMSYDTIIKAMQKEDMPNEFPDKKEVTTNDIMYSMMSSMFGGIYSNDITDFKSYISKNNDSFAQYTNDIKYIYDVDLNVYKNDYSITENTKLNPFKIPDEMKATLAQFEQMMKQMQIWEQLIDNQKLLDEQYDVLAGNWPTQKNEIVIFVDTYNQINDYTLYSLGLKDISELQKMIMAMQTGAKLEIESKTFSFDDLLNMKYKLVLTPDYYEKKDGVWSDMSDNTVYMKNVIDNSLELKVSGIVRLKPDVNSSAVTGSIGYSKLLTDYIIDATNASAIVTEQKANPDVNVMTALPFGQDVGKIEEALKVIMQSLTDEQKAKIMEQGESFASMDTDEQIQFFASIGVDISSIEPLLTQSDSYSLATYISNMETFGVVDYDAPKSIYLYPSGFESKDELTKLIENYNTDKNDDEKIKYTDYVGLLMSSVTTIINAVSYVLIAFVTISLVVSSIMIGIITYISVLERTKEIGILRSIGASKKDISRVFNAETLIVGFTAGAIGIIITLLLNIPINIIIESLADISGVAKLPWVAGVILVLISMFLTFIAGLIPSRLAAKKDPVIALRTE